MRIYCIKEIVNIIVDFLRFPVGAPFKHVNQKQDLDSSITQGGGLGLNKKDVDTLGSMYKCG